MTTSRKKHAACIAYVSQNQLTIAGFETPFSKNLDKNNRWVVLAGKIPWDELAFPSVRWALRHCREVAGQAVYAPFANPPDDLADYHQLMD